MLAVSGLHAWYGESHILHGVDLEEMKKQAPKPTADTPGEEPSFAEQQQRLECILEPGEHVAHIELVCLRTLAAQQHAALDDGR